MLRLPHHRFVQFADLSGPVRFTGCDDLIEAIESILCGWDVREVSRDQASWSPMRVTRTREGYRRVTPRHPTPSRSRDKLRPDVVSALCGFHFELIDWFSDEHADRTYIHGAGVESEDGLTLFPALAKAGKSTLTVALAAEGRRIHTDDVVPVDLETGEAVALGIAPRLRPPLPENAPALRAFVEEHSGPARGNRQYIRLPEGRLAPLGARAPIQRIVLLKRKKSGPARLKPVSAGDALERIILQNFTRELPAGDILDTLHRVVEGADCYKLRYSAVDDAVAALPTIQGDG
ncbi:MAG: hypothetical protein QNJ98_11555 [Planctomycetota bacterium]|nr:hypothetical protein [Planctomycetota bacterium]